MNVSRILAIIPALISLSLPACSGPADAQSREEHHKIVATSPLAKDVIITQQYVCQIHSRKHIDVKALQGGYLEAIPIKEGQAVKQKEVLFQILPTLYMASLAAETAEARLAELEFKNTEGLHKEKVPVVSEMEVALYAAKYAKALARKQRAEAELKFATITAPFDGIVDRLFQQEGSLIKEGEVLTTLSDNSVMWVYFNVPEARYLEDMADASQDRDTRQIELVLANGSKFPQKCQSLTREAQFNNETGNIQYRADFPNPDRLLRHGQTGNILIHRTLKDAIVIPQRATFEILDKRYVWVVDNDGAVHQREIVVQYEQDDIFVINKLETIKAETKKEETKKEAHKTEETKKEEHKKEEHKKGLDVNERIVIEGVRQVRDGEKVESEFRPAEEVLANQKKHAE